MTATLRAFTAGVLLLMCAGAHAEIPGLTNQKLAVVFSVDDPRSAELARFYAAERSIPPENILGVRLPDVDVIAAGAFAPIRADLLSRLPTTIQSLLLVWARPYAVGCMSITTAVAAGYRDSFCEPGCGRTARNPLYDAPDWLPADTVGWWPAMMLPSADTTLAHRVIHAGVTADTSPASGTLYLVNTADRARNVRAANYHQAQLALGARLHTVELTAPVDGPIDAALGYFTGASQVGELPRIAFRPGAIADHLTSSGGVLYGKGQMSALAWLRQGATASYGTVSEPCNLPEKFPEPRVLFEHLLHGDTVLEAYWKSVQMPGQGLFIGEPLARPFAGRRT